MNIQQHWDSVYQSKSDEELSWTQPEPVLSLALIAEVCPAGRVIDIGGGSSVLAEKLLHRGYAVTVLDVSEAALARTRKRLGAEAEQIVWIAADATAVAPHLEHCDVWHDRAVFHFLTDPAGRADYQGLLTRTVVAGGHAVIATFALDGPERCSGLAVRRYDGASLSAELGTQFVLLKSIREVHVTPWGKVQSFQYSLFRRV